MLSVLIHFIYYYYYFLTYLMRTQLKILMKTNTSISSRIRQSQVKSHPGQFSPRSNPTPVKSHPGQFSPRSNPIPVNSHPAQLKIYIQYYLMNYSINSFTGASDLEQQTETVRFTALRWIHFNFLSNWKKYYGVATHLGYFFSRTNQVHFKNFSRTF